MGASQETFLWVKITQVSFQIIKWYLPKKKAFIYDLFESLCSEIGKKLHWYMGVWGRQLPEASDILKNQIKWKPDIYFLKRKLHFHFF